MQAFHTANGSFPPGLAQRRRGIPRRLWRGLRGRGGGGCTGCGPNWEVAILPQIEQPAMYQSVLNCLTAQTTLDVCSNCNFPESVAEQSIRLAVAWPSDPAYVRLSGWRRQRRQFHREGDVGDVWDCQGQLWRKLGARHLGSAEYLRIHRGRGGDVRHGPIAHVLARPVASRLEPGNPDQRRDRWHVEHDAGERIARRQLRP